MKGHQVVDIEGRRHSFQYFNDFDAEVDANELVVTAASTGTAAVGNGEWGIIPLTTAATNNDDVTIEHPNEFVTFSADKPWTAYFLVNWNEINVDDANIAIGLANAPASGMCVNDGGGFITTNTSCAVVYKVDGGTLWSCTAGASAATQAANRKASNVPACSGIAGVNLGWQWIEIIWTPVSSTLGYVEFRINDRDLRDTGVEGQPRIRIPVVIGAAATMTLFASVKAGAAAIETLNVDLWGIVGRRNRPTG